MSPFSDGSSDSRLTLESSVAASAAHSKSRLRQSSQTKEILDANTSLWTSQSSGRTRSSGQMRDDVHLSTTLTDTGRDVPESQSTTQVSRNSKPRVRNPMQALSSRAAQSNTSDKGRPSAPEDNNTAVEVPHTDNYCPPNVENTPADTQSPNKSSADAHSIEKPRTLISLASTHTIEKAKRKMSDTHSVEKTTVREPAGTHTIEKPKRNLANTHTLEKTTTKRNLANTHTIEKEKRSLANTHTIEKTTTKRNLMYSDGKEQTGTIKKMVPTNTEMEPQISQADVESEQEVLTTQPLEQRRQHITADRSCSDVDRVAQSQADKANSLAPDSDIGDPRPTESDNNTEMDDSGSYTEEARDVMLTEQVEEALAAGAQAGPSVVPDNITSNNTQPSLTPYNTGSLNRHGNELGSLSHLDNQTRITTYMESNNSAIISFRTRKQ